MTTCVWTGVASARHAESSQPAGFVDLCSQAASKNNMIENTVVFAHGTRCVRFAGVRAMSLTAGGQHRHG